MIQWPNLQFFLSLHGCEQAPGLKPCAASYQLCLPILLDVLIILFGKLVNKSPLHGFELVELHVHHLDHQAGGVVGLYLLESCMLQYLTIVLYCKEVISSTVDVFRKLDRRLLVSTAVV